MYRKMWIAIILAAVILCASPTANAVLGITNLWLVQADGSRATQLTNFQDSSYDCEAWDLSPDGNHVMVATPGELRVIDLHGMTVATIPTGVYIPEGVQWHSDNYITFVAWYGEGQRGCLGLQWPDGKIEEIYPGNSSWLSVSPDRQWLIDTPIKQDARPASLVRLENDTTRQLPYEGSWRAIWAPDSNFVALGHSESVGIVDTSGQLIREIEAIVCIPLAWTPNTGHLVLCLYDRAGDSIVRMDPATGFMSRRMPVHGLVFEGCPSPDESKIAFTQYESWDVESDREDSLWISDWAGPGNQIMSTNGGYISGIKWLPDGSSMIVEWRSEFPNPKPQLFRRPAGFSAGPSGVDTNEPDFRNARWGMTMSEVRASETACSLRVVGDDGTDLIGSTSLAGYFAMVGYEFDRAGRLVKGIYVLDEMHTEANRYLDDFDDLKALLTAKYGEPVSDYPIWKNELFKNQRTSWGLAAQMGHVTFGSIWETPRTRITMILTGDNFTVTHGIIYTSKDPANEPTNRDTTGL